MNTSKQITIMVALVFLSLIATGAYTLWDPDRASDAEVRQEDRTLERAAWLFSQNCRVCHGDAGEGGAAANRLGAAPPLNRPDLQGREDENSEPDAVLKATSYNLIFNTVTCGRVGTAMPAWGRSQGGPLNEHQITQLTQFISEGTAWEEAREFGVRGAPEHGHPGDDQYKLALAAPLSGTSTDVNLRTTRTLEEGQTTVSPLSPGTRLQVGDELMLVQEADQATDTVTVERGLGNTDPVSHDEGEEVLAPPVPPEPASINEYACGQRAVARPTAGPAGPTPTPAANAQELTVAGVDLTFDPETLTASAGQPITVTFDNQDEGIQHNIVFYDGPDADAEEIAGTDIETGPVVQTLSFGPLDPGEYFYDCQVHPTQMQGVLTVQ